jgi:hypothetical protein
LDFSSYTEARLHARCKSRAINASATAIKIVDITNSKDVTNTSSFTNDGNWHTQTTLWRALDAATIVGLATFELEGSAGSSTDILDVGTVILELRRG